MNELIKKLQEFSISIAPLWNQPKTQRLKSQWVKARKYNLPEGTFHDARFGDFSRSLSEFWCDYENASEIVKEKIEHIKGEEERERIRIQEINARRLDQEITQLSLGNESHPYIKRKNVGVYGDIRCVPSTNALIVPMRDVDGKLWNVQRILSEKILLDRTGEYADKFFTPGCRIDECFHLLLAESAHPQEHSGLSPDLTKITSVYIAEGYATGASIYEALERSETVIVAFNSQNLPKVARALREKNPELKIIICADNDQWKADKGNAGVKKAREAAELVGGDIIVPVFPPEHHHAKPTDFNDMHALMGLDTVRAQILGVYEPNAIKPLLPQGKAKKISELAIVTALLNHYEGRLLCQGRDFFVYGDGHWKHLGAQGEVLMKRTIAEILGNSQASKDINSAYQLLLIKCPQPPKRVDLFAPEFYRVNFENGTLHAHITPGKKIELKFKDHNPLDYIVNKVPFPYNPEPSDTNTEWLQYLNRVFMHDQDREDKIRSLAQLFGASLLPCYSRIFLLVGKPGSGKSTIMKVLARLVGETNISRVQPSDFEGFNLVTMVGKTLNMDTDINTKKPIADDIVKKIIDRAPFHVRRKFQDDLYSPLPPMHVFGGNDLPRSSDGETAAYGRRVIILRTGSMQVSETNYDHDYAEQLWDAGPGGILGFAVRGLQDLLERRGHFTVPASSSLEVEKWNMESDIIAQFLLDLEHGAISDSNNTFGLKEYGEEGQIERKNFYELFKDWFKSAHPHGRIQGRNTFFRVVEGKGFGVKAVNGVRYFTQANIKAAENSLI